MGEEIPQVTPELTKEFKFNNCSFRSDDEEVKLIRTCSCPKLTELKGYHCSIHSLFPLNMDFCGFCKDFKQK